MTIQSGNHVNITIQSTTSDFRQLIIQLIKVDINTVKLCNEIQDTNSHAMCVENMSYKLVTFSQRNFHCSPCRLKSKSSHFSHKLPQSVLQSRRQRFYSQIFNFTKQNNRPEKWQKKKKNAIIHFNLYAITQKRLKKTKGDPQKQKKVSPRQ